MGQRHRAYELGPVRACFLFAGPRTARRSRFFFLFFGGGDGGRDRVHATVWDLPERCLSWRDHHQGVPLASCNASYILCKSASAAACADMFLLYEPPLLHPSKGRGEAVQLGFIAGIPEGKTRE